MRRGTLALAVLGILVVRGVAAEPLGQPVPIRPAPVIGPYGIVGQPAFVPLPGGCGASCSENCGTNSAGGNRLQKFLDFLCYRPSPACDCGPRPTNYTPPLHAWFPNCCHANHNCGATCCAKSGGLKAGKAGCDSCGVSQLATIGKPVVRPMIMPSTQTLGLSKTVTRAPLTYPSAPRTMPGGLVATPIQKPGQPPVMPASANGSLNGSRVQPSNYYLPARK